MGYIPPNENGSPVPKAPAFKPTPMPVRGAPTPPVNKQAPVQMPLKGAPGTFGRKYTPLKGGAYNANRKAMNKKMSYAAAARKKLGGM